MLLACRSPKLKERLASCTFPPLAVSLAFGLPLGILPNSLDLVLEFLFPSSTCLFRYSSPVIGRAAISHQNHPSIVSADSRQLNSRSYEPGSISALS